jgi:hypothetical protein
MANDNYTSLLTTIRLPHKPAASETVLERRINLYGDARPESEEDDGRVSEDRECPKGRIAIRYGSEDGPEVHKGGEIAIADADGTHLENASGSF